MAIVLKKGSAALVPVSSEEKDRLHGRYARVCLLVDLGKQLMLGFSLDEEDFYIEYEGLHGLCTCCGVYGHKSSECKTGTNAVEKGLSGGSKAAREENGDSVMKDSTKSDLEVWKVVQHPR